MPPFLAHGALGIYDELIFAGVGIAFLVMMGVSWLRSRNLPYDDEDDAKTPVDSEGAPQEDDRFRLH
jgi:hypothetical protein